MAVTADGTAHLREVFLSLMPPTPGDRRLAMGVVICSVGVFLALAPFATTKLAPSPAFIPAYQAALFISDLITAVVLLGQYSVLRTRALLLLGTAYLFTAFALVPHTLSFPGLFAPGGLLGSGPQTTVWLYMFWHAGFPLLVIGYAFTKDDQRPLPTPIRSLFKSIAAAFAAVVLFTGLTTLGQEMLPPIMAGNGYTPFQPVAMSAVLALSALALLVLWWRRPHTILDLWMMVVMTAWVFDIGLSATLNAGRYDLGFYSGRIYGLIAATFVMAMMLLETRSLYARAAASLLARSTVAESRADRAQRESRESAATLRAVVDSSSQAIVAITPDRRVALWNPAAERIFGYSAGDLLNQPYPLACGDDGHARLLDSAMAGAPAGSKVFRSRRKDGTPRDIRGSAALLRDANGAASGIVCLFEDVTEHLATEEMLRQSQKMEAVGQLTGGLAHDFNNVIMVILANVEAMLEEQSLDPAVRDRLARVEASSQRAADLTRRLLAFSRKQQLSPQSTDLTELVGGTTKLLQRTLGQQIEIEMRFEKNLWHTEIDCAQLEAALVNLCVNARDAMPSGGCLIIETRNAVIDSSYADFNPEMQAGEYVVLSVSDTGLGIPADLLGRVFEPFFTTKAPGRGTGLGLSMVYGFVKQSNGHIKIYSEEGHGTTIRMYFPRGGAGPVPSAQAPAAVPRGTESVLMVEDDPQVAAVVLRQLESLGYQVSHAADGRAALERLSAASFDLLLTDAVMPGGIDGWRLADTVAKRWARTRILLMSGYSEAFAAGSATLGDRVRVIAKPFRKVELARTIREVLDA
jgi:PAS domain S-box-containing protein